MDPLSPALEHALEAQTIQLNRWLYAAGVGADRAFAGELRHREEHALELIAVWLHHMRGGRPRRRRLAG